MRKQPQYSIGETDMPPQGECPSHNSFAREILGAIAGLEKVVTSQIASLKEDIGRRFEESLEDRRRLHERQDALSQDVTRALTRLNGAQLLKAEPGDIPRTRREDNPFGWLTENWKILLLVVILSALAGEKLIPFALRLVGLGGS